MSKFNYILIFIIITSFISCEKKVNYITSSSQIKQNMAVYYGTMKDLYVHVAYEDSAKPFCDENIPTPAGQLDLWDVVEQNLDYIFNNERDQSITLHVPKNLTGMTKLNDQNQVSWTIDEIQALARGSCSTSISGSEAHFCVLFLKGNYETNGSPDPNIIGVNIVGTSIIAIFKDVIGQFKDPDCFNNNCSDNDAKVQKYAEQSTLVHELGHAIGFVNNGIPDTLSLEDSTHPKHSKVEDSVMYWANEAQTGLTKFLKKFFSSHTLILWDDESSEVVGYQP